MKVSETERRESIMRKIRERRRSARAADGRMARATGDLFERIKVKMVTRIYHVSCKRAKAIIAGRAAEKEALDVKKTPRNWVRISRHVCDDDDELL